MVHAWSMERTGKGNTGVSGCALAGQPSRRKRQAKTQGAKTLNALQTFFALKKYFALSPHTDTLTHALTQETTPLRERDDTPREYMRMFVRVVAISSPRPKTDHKSRVPHNCAGGPHHDMLITRISASPHTRPAHLSTTARAIRRRIG